jgi:hypothetical protein
LTGRGLGGYHVKLLDILDKILVLLHLAVIIVNLALRDLLDEDLGLGIDFVKFSPPL